ncbi:MAG TPA: SGNH hydrolase domain-containing protein, partial [Nocardioidaceae bacterium]|nr:SGNH hydrolase domain-containing protein [Nocardioidaceae bacterium]
YLLVEEPARRIRLPTLRWLGVGVLLSGTVVASAVLVVVLAPTTTGSGAAARLAPAAPGAQAHLAVRRAVAAGLEVKAVPRNVTPAPADAADSLPPTSRNGCHAGFAAVSQGACAYGDVAARRTVVLFGDSHVEQWLPAFDAVGSRQRLRVVSWTKAACPAAGLPVRNPALNRAYVECDQWRTATIDKIRRLRPALVVVGQSENVASSSVPPDTFAAATVATVRRLGLPAGRMIYLHDIPIPGEDLPGCVADNLEDVGACGFARSDAYTYPDRHEAVASAVRAADVRVVDPADWLCAEERCPAVVGNVLVYRNESHITVPYSRWLAPALWSSVRDAARASAPSPPTQEP